LIERGDQRLSDRVHAGSLVGQAEVSRLAKKSGGKQQWG